MAFLNQFRLHSKLIYSYRKLHGFVQGQSLETNIREYFYFIDHQGQLFLDDTKIKNFTSCFKEKQFLKFFYSRIVRNTTGRYEQLFPYLSLCGRERNFVRCDDIPVVFTEFSQPCESTESSLAEDKLLYAGGMLSVTFQPSQVMMHPMTGRVYHTGPERAGGVGLIKSSLAIELSRLFHFETGGTVPTHLTWRGHTHKLDYEISAKLLECHRLLPRDDDTIIK